MTATETKKSNSVIVVLALAQFLMVIDTAVMNVSITTLVNDFNTTVTVIQSVITLYSLVMAAAMITGGKLGDRWGRLRAFRIGLVVYGIGSGITAISPTVGVLAFGWSLLEGLGAALVMPALAALVGSTYTGKQRALAYGILGGVAGAAVAVGPIIGGYMTTYHSWRLVFAGEVVLVVIILLGSRLITGVGAGEPTPIDVPSALLSAAGLGVVVYGVLQSTTWGWVTPKDSPFELFGFSATLFVVAAGFVLLAIFFDRQQRLADRGATPLVSPRLLKISPLHAGLLTLTAQQTILMGIFFVIPIFLQIVIGLDAFETGVRLLPVSVTLFAFATIGSRLVNRFSPRAIVRVGLLIVLIGAVVLLSAIDTTLDGAAFVIGLALVGTGFGLLSSQLGNVIQSAVDDESRGEAGGLQYTAQNLGSALGTALIGAVVLGSLATTTINSVTNDPTISNAVAQQVQVTLTGQVNFVPVDSVHAAATSAGLDQQETDALVGHYEDAELRSLKAGLLAAAFLTLLSLWFTRSLPANVVPSPDDESAHAAVDP